MAQQARLSPRRRLGTFRLGEDVAHNTPSGFWGFNESNVNAHKGSSTEFGVEKGHASTQ